MKPALVELDYLRAPRQTAKASWLLLAVALAFSGDAALSYLKARSEFSARTERLARLRGGRPAATAHALPASREELAAARETILRLSLPWENLFQALQSARSEDVALLSVEPDVDSGRVNISGEAKNYPAVLTYVAWLGAEKALADVYLAKHEMRQNDPRRLVSFTVSAKWREGR